ncbi:transposase [Cohnella fermenti]
MKYWLLRNQVRGTFRSEKEDTPAVRRMIESEPVFGAMKNNRGFKRFLLRGLPEVSLEVGLLLLAHSLLNKAEMDATNQGAKREQAA